ncbi:MAG: dTDP-4-amino-4,6-dideoxygalactose transaminase [Candidatus Cloacimonadota bacterium]|nr:MAG: dTDP-4-amino-4,6-dideoxygalactose transaminase [Candidatus Cloacimonadota bacterium]
MKIPFNKPLITGSENKYLDEVFANDRFSGNGKLTERCNSLLEEKIGCKKSIMTSSCTDALEMAGLLSFIEPGDEVIMPSFTFVSTASAFELRKAEIVWCDIRKDTKNIDEEKIESLITSKTKAIVVVHYAGVACEMDKIKEICDTYKLFLIEDAAQAIDCSYKGKPLGSIGDLATLSFHETKNIHCGEGGALLVNNPGMTERAQFIRDKGTNRIHFNQGKVDKYTWVELGSSYLMSELQAAFLFSQLQSSESINLSRVESWNYYYKLLSEFIPKERLPLAPDYCKHNAHMFYIMCSSFEERKSLTAFLSEHDISAIFHYVPLHKAPYWKGKYSQIHLPVTNEVSETLLRLPLYYGISKEEIELVAEKIKEFFHDK